MKETVRTVTSDEMVPILQARIERLEAQIAELQGFAEFARGQIAAKDAALQQIAKECSTFPIKNGRLAFRCESIALNALSHPAPAQEDTP